MKNTKKSKRITAAQADAGCGRCRADRTEQIVKSGRGISRRKAVLVSVLALLIVAALSLTVYGIVLFSFHTVTEATVKTFAIDSLPSVSFAAESLSFDRAGEKRDITLQATNSTGTPVKHKYMLSYVNATGDDLTNRLAKAIYVYYDGEFVNTLSALCPSAGTNGMIDIANLIPANAEGGTRSDSHLISLELHVAADSELYKNKTITLTLTDVSENADYTDYIFVSNEAEWRLAVEDINSGLISPEVTVVLAESITLTDDYEIKYPCKIDLYANKLDMNGHTVSLTAAGKTVSVTTGEGESAVTTQSFVPAEIGIVSSMRYPQGFAAAPTGSIVLDSEGCVLDIADMKAANGTLVGRIYGARVTIDSCYADGVTELLQDKFRETVGDGFSQGTARDAFGALSFYTTYTNGGSPLVLASAPVSLADGTLTAPAANVTYVTKITIGNEITEYKIYADASYDIFSSLFAANGELYHLVTLGADNEIVTSEIFLPVALKNKSVTIEWQSSNTEVMDNTGNLADEVGNKTPVSLLATVKIGDRVYTKTFSFVVSSQNNQTRFNSFMAQLGTIDLTDVYKGQNADKAFVYLPIVDPDYAENGYTGYDYRSSFTTPSSAEAQYHLVWDAYDDISFNSIEYTAISTYSYVSVYQNGADRAVYLNTPVFSNFAQILIKATFYDDTDEGNELVEYTGFVNITIHPGTYAELLEIVFEDVNIDLNDIDIYKNIVDTRKVGGMLNQTGDFTLSTIYRDSDKYKIEYSKSSVNNAVTGVTESSGEDRTAVIHVNPVNFSSVESTAYVHVKVSYTSDSTVFAERDLPFRIPAVILPDSIGFDNFSVFSSIQYQVWCHLPADEKNGTTGFSIANGVLTNRNAPYILVKDVEKANIPELRLYVDSDSSSTLGASAVVYNMTKLIKWATGKDKISVGGLGNAFSSMTQASLQTLSDGNDYMTPTEVAVLKEYYESVTTGRAGAVSWSSFWSGITYSPEGRVVTDGYALATAAKGMLSDDMYFKYYEIYMWATNIKDEVEGASTNNGVPVYAYPCSSSFYTYGSHTVTLLNGQTQTFTFSKASGKDKTTFGEDNTEYISAPEEAVLRHFIYSKGTGNEETDEATYLTAFLAYTTFPTYLKDGAVNTIVNNIYAALGYTTETVYSAGQGFTASVYTENGVAYPRISNADGAFSALMQFTDLISFTLSGDITVSGSSESAGMPAFLQTPSVKTFFSRLTINQTGLTKLVLRNLAQDYTVFNLEGIEKLSAVTHLDLGCSFGINNIGNLLNAGYKQLTYLDVCGCNELYKYKEFTLLAVYNLAVNRPTIYYTPDGSSVRAVFNEVRTVPEALTYLHEMDTVDSAYLQLLGSASDNNDIIWDVVEGNDVAGTVTHPSNQHFTDVNTVAGMERLLTSYYYCTESNGGYVKDHIYKINYQNGAFTLVDTGVTGQIINSISGTVEDISDATIGSGYSSEQGQPATNTSTGAETTQSVRATYTIYNSSNEPLSSTPMRNLRYQTVTKSTTTTWRVYYNSTATKEMTDSNVYYYTGPEMTVGADTLGTDSVITAVTYRYESITSYYIDIEETVSQTYRVYTGYKRSTLSTSFTAFASTAAYMSYNNVYYLINIDTAPKDRTYTECGTPTTGYSHNGIALSGVSDVQAFVQQRSSLVNGAPVFTYNGTQYDYTRSGTPTVTNGVAGITHYISYAAPINSTSTGAGYITATTDRVNMNDGYYRYTGAAGSATAYYQSATAVTNSYTVNNYYRLAYNSTTGRLAFTNTTSSGLYYSNANDSMEGLLATANAARYTDGRGLYFGNCYYYTGSTSTVNGHSYNQNYIYKMEYDTATGFYFKELSSCTSVSDENTFINYLYQAVTDPALDGSFYYLSANSNTWRFGANFYRISMDETGTYMMMTYGALLEESTTRLTNTRIYDPSMYNGTGGSAEAVISATVVIDGTEYTRLFHVTVVGTKQ